MAISKRLRFELFKRDGFTCQYCGQRPPDVVLELDHIDPRCSGGTDDEINLVTSCFQCNRGKADKKLGDVRPRPDADLKYLEIEQELAEADRYLKASRVREKLIARISYRLRAVWLEIVTLRFEPTQKQWHTWLAFFSPEEIEFAMRRTGPKLHSGQFGDRDSEYAVNQTIRYMSGIMQNVRKQGQSDQRNVQ